MEREVGKGALNGIMEKSLKGNGSRERRMGLEFGNLPEEIFMKASGKTTGKTAKDITSIKEAQSIEALLKSF